MKTAHITQQPDSAPPGQTTSPWNLRPMRRLCGLAIAAIGLSALIASAQASTIPVQDPSFETPGVSPGGPWAAIGAVWNSNIGNWAQTNDNSRFATRTDAGTWYANLTDNLSLSINQDLLTTVTTGQSLAVTFYVGRELGQVGGVIAATFIVGTTEYTQNFDATGLTQGTWQSYTLTKTIGNTGNLRLKFMRVSGRPWLDNVSNVTVTAAAVPNGEPTTTAATLTAVEDVAIALSAANFGYADPNTPASALQAVRITSLPLLGTLKNGLVTLESGNLPLDVPVANIGNLTYQSALHGYGTAYTTIGIKVQNSVSPTGLWSVADGVMTVNVTHVNHAPTSTGGAVSLKANTVKTFAAANFQFSDIDAGDTLGAIKITSLPTHGTLSLNGTPSSIGDVVPVASIPTLTYTPTTDYNGSDPFNFQVRDAVLFSADATMAVTITVNQVPTSTGAAVVLHTNTVKTFAVANFPFADGDVGDTLQAIEVTSLPANGTLKLNGTAITTVPSAAIPVANIGTLTYTPVTGYNGADSFKFQVSDGIAFSADATMAITVTPDILVLNGSFETTGQALGGPWFKFGSPWSITNSPSNYQVINAVTGGAFNSTVAGGGTYIGLINVDDCPITAPLVQNLGVSVTAGDTLTVTFQRGNPKISSGGAGVAYFDVAGTKYTTAFDTSGMTAGTWQLTTMTQTITNSGNLTLGFYGTTGNGFNVWLDLISNVSVTASGPTPGSFAAWALANAPGQNPSQDSNNDGVPNGVAYFMGQTGLATLPVLDPATSTIGWPMSSTYSGSYQVQTSADLSTWTAVSPQPTRDSGTGLLSYTLPTGLGTQFVRLVVTPN